MADEAFALSPISARAAQPREEDYDAISEAFMETSRGRWFLGEYAKRNRNADTRMVLDAVAKIEQTLAAQKQPEPEPVSDTGLSDAIAAIKAALSEARLAATAAIDGLALEQHLAPVRKGRAGDLGNLLALARRSALTAGSVICCRSGRWQRHRGQLRRYFVG